jgi:hypothetical protein
MGFQSHWLSNIDIGDQKKMARKEWIVHIIRHTTFELVRYHVCSIVPSAVIVKPQAIISSVIIIQKYDKVWVVLIGPPPKSYTVHPLDLIRSTPSLIGPGHPLSLKHQ